MSFDKTITLILVAGGWFMLSMILTGIGMGALDLSNEASVALLIPVMGLCGVGAFYHSKRKLKAIDDKIENDARKAEEYALFVEDQAREYGAIIDAIQSSDGAFLTQNVPKPLIEEYHTPKKNEVIFWLGFVSMGRYVTRTDSYQYHGPRYRIQIAKGLSYQAGSTKVHRNTSTNLEVDSVGTLVISNRGVYYTPLDLESSGWSKTWNSINRWQLLQGAISFQLSSGKPPVFFCHGAKNPNWKYPEMWGEPEIVGLAAKYASQT